MNLVSRKLLRRQYFCGSILSMQWMFAARFVLNICSARGLETVKPFVQRSGPSNTDRCGVHST